MSYKLLVVSAGHNNQFKYTYIRTYVLCIHTHTHTHTHTHV